MSLEQESKEKENIINAYKMEYEQIRQSIVSNTRSFDQSYGNKENLNMKSFEVKQNQWKRNQLNSKKDKRSDLMVNARPMQIPVDVQSSQNS